MRKILVILMICFVVIGISGCIGEDQENQTGEDNQESNSDSNADSGSGSDDNGGSQGQNNVNI